MDVSGSGMLTVLMVDQRVGEMSSWRQRRGEYRATGVPSARGGNAVGPPAFS
jgi:hypothetical protein